jgi:hypothetical protein
MQIGLNVDPSTGDERVVQPAKTRTVLPPHGRGHCLSLPLRRDHDALAGRPFQDRHFGMTAEKFKIFDKVPGRNSVCIHFQIVPLNRPDRQALFFKATNVRNKLAPKLASPDGRITHLDNVFRLTLT